MDGLEEGAGLEVGLSRAANGKGADGGRIPREEVREIDDCVMEHLEAFLPGCESTITGG